MSPTFSAARESMAIISGSGSDNATTPERGNTSVELGHPGRERTHSPMQRSTSGRQRGHLRKRVVYTVLQRGPSLLQRQPHQLQST